MTTLQRTSGMIALWLTIAMTMSGCGVIEGLFKAGLWVGIIGILLLVGIVGGVFALLKR